VNPNHNPNRNGIKRKYLTMVCLNFSLRHSGSIQISEFLRRIRVKGLSSLNSGSCNNAIFNIFDSKYSCSANVGMPTARQIRKILPGLESLKSISSIWSKGSINSVYFNLPELESNCSDSNSSVFCINSLMELTSKVDLLQASE